MSALASIPALLHKLSTGDSVTIATGHYKKHYNLCYTHFQSLGGVQLAAGRLQLGEEAAYQADEDFVGTPSQLIEQMRPFVELGVDYFMLDCGGFPKLTTVEMLVNEVLPALNHGTSRKDA